MIRLLYLSTCLFVSALSGLVSAQVVMESPFVPAYIFDFAYTAGCPSDACFPTVFSGLDENGDPIYIEHTVEFDFSGDLEAGSLILGSGGKLTTVSGPVRKSIENVFLGLTVDLNTAYSGVRSYPVDDLGELVSGDCLIKPEIVLEGLDLDDCLSAGVALHGTVTSFEVSSPDCTAPDGFIEFAFDNSEFSPPQLTYEWENGASPDPICDEESLLASLEELPDLGAPIEDGCPIFLPPCTPNELRALYEQELIEQIEADGDTYALGAIPQSESTKALRTSRTMGSWFDLPQYTTVGPDLTDDYEEDGEIDGGTVTPSPPLGGYVPSEDSGGDDGNDIVEFCAANPTAALCQMVDSGLINSAVSAQEGMADDVDSLIGEAGGILDVVNTFEFGAGPVLGPAVSTCPLFGGLVISSDPPIVLDTEPYCEISGGPIRMLIGILATVNAAIVLFRGLASM